MFRSSSVDQFLNQDFTQSLIFILSQTANRLPTDGSHQSLSDFFESPKQFKMQLNINNEEVLIDIIPSIFSCFSKILVSNTSISKEYMASLIGGVVILLGQQIVRSGDLVDFFQRKTGQTLEAFIDLIANQLVKESKNIKLYSDQWDQFLSNATFIMKEGEKLSSGWKKFILIKYCGQVIYKQLMNDPATLTRLDRNAIHLIFLNDCVKARENFPKDRYLLNVLIEFFDYDYLKWNQMLSKVKSQDLVHLLNLFSVMVTQDDFLLENCIKTLVVILENDDQAVQINKLSRVIQIAVEQSSKIVAVSPKKKKLSNRLTRRDSLREKKNTQNSLNYAHNILPKSLKRLLFSNNANILKDDVDEFSITVEKEMSKIESLLKNFVTDDLKKENWTDDDFSQWFLKLWENPGLLTVPLGTIEALFKFLTKSYKELPFYYRSQLFSNFIIDLLSLLDFPFYQWGLSSELELLIRNVFSFHQSFSRPETSDTEEIFCLSYLISNGAGYPQFYANFMRRLNSFHRLKKFFTEQEISNFLPIASKRFNDDLVISFLDRLAKSDKEFNVLDERLFIDALLKIKEFWRLTQATVVQTSSEDLRYLVDNYRKLGRNRGERARVFLTDIALYYFKWPDVFKNEDLLRKFIRKVLNFLSKSSDKSTEEIPHEVRLLQKFLISGLERMEHVPDNIRDVFLQNFFRIFNAISFFYDSQTLFSIAVNFISSINHFLDGVGNSTILFLTFQKHIESNLSGWKISNFDQKLLNIIKERFLFLAKLQKTGEKELTGTIEDFFPGFNRDDNQMVSSRLVAIVQSIYGYFKNSNQANLSYEKVKNIISFVQNRDKYLSDLRIMEIFKNNTINVPLMFEIYLQELLFDENIDKGFVEIVEKFFRDKSEFLENNELLDLQLVFGFFIRLIKYKNEGYYHFSKSFIEDIFKDFWGYFGQRIFSQKGFSNQSWSDDRVNFIQQSFLNDEAFQISSLNKSLSYESVISFFIGLMRLVEQQCLDLDANFLKSVFREEQVNNVLLYQSIISNKEWLKVRPYSNEWYDGQIALNLLMKSSTDSDRTLRALLSILLQSHLYLVDKLLLKKHLVQDEQIIVNRILLEDFFHSIAVASSNYKIPGLGRVFPESLTVASLWGQLTHLYCFAGNEKGQAVGLGSILMKLKSVHDLLVRNDKQATQYMQLLRSMMKERPEFFTTSFVRWILTFEDENQISNLLKVLNICKKIKFKNTSEFKWVLKNALVTKESSRGVIEGYKEKRINLKLSFSRLFNEVFQHMIEEEDYERFFNNLSLSLSAVDTVKVFVDNLIENSRKAKETKDFRVDEKSLTLARDWMFILLRIPDFFSSEPKVLINRANKIISLVNQHYELMAVILSYLKEKDFIEGGFWGQDLMESYDNLETGLDNFIWFANEYLKKYPGKGALPFLRYHNFSLLNGSMVNEVFEFLSALPGGLGQIVTANFSVYEYFPFEKIWFLHEIFSQKNILDENGLYFLGMILDYFFRAKIDFQDTEQLEFFTILLERIDKHLNTFQLEDLELITIACQHNDIGRCSQFSIPTDFFKFLREVYFRLPEISNDDLLKSAQEIRAIFEKQQEIREYYLSSARLIPIMKAMILRFNDHLDKKTKKSFIENLEQGLGVLLNIVNNLKQDERSVPFYRKFIEVLISTYINNESLQKITEVTEKLNELLNVIELPKASKVSSSYSDSTLMSSMREDFTDRDSTGSVNTSSSGMEEMIPRKNARELFRQLFEGKGVFSKCVTYQNEIFHGMDALLTAFKSANIENDLSERVARKILTSFIADDFNKKKKRTLKTIYNFESFVGTSHGCWIETLLKLEYPFDQFHGKKRTAIKRNLEKIKNVFSEYFGGEELALQYIPKLLPVAIEEQQILKTDKNIERKKNQTDFDIYFSRLLEVLNDGLLKLPGEFVQYCHKLTTLTIDEIVDILLQHSSFSLEGRISLNEVKSCITTLSLKSGLTAQQVAEIIRNEQFSHKNSKTIRFLSSFLSNELQKDNKKLGENGSMAQKHFLYIYKHPDLLKLQPQEFERIMKDKDWSENLGSLAQLVGTDGFDTKIEFLILNFTWPVVLKDPGRLKEVQKKLLNEVKKLDENDWDRFNSEAANSLRKLCKVAIDQFQKFKKNENLLTFLGVGLNLLVNKGFSSAKETKVDLEELVKRNKLDLNKQKETEDKHERIHKWTLGRAPNGGFFKKDRRGLEVKENLDVPVSTLSRVSKSVRE